VRDKIVLVRYGQNFRGSESSSWRRSAARPAVIIYSDPASTTAGGMATNIPQGPWRPDTGVQRGSVGYMFEFPGDPTTPGIASVPYTARKSQRISPEKSAQMPKIPCHAAFLSRCLAHARSIWVDRIRRAIGKARCRFTYHIGPGPVRK
jgi:N-acetylated-alpha-linked acidic dipeptidase